MLTTCFSCCNLRDLRNPMFSRIILISSRISVVCVQVLCALDLRHVLQEVLLLCLQSVLHASF